MKKLATKKHYGDLAKSSEIEADSPPEIQLELKRLSDLIRQQQELVPLLMGKLESVVPTTDEVWEEVGRQCNLLPDELETMKEEIWSGYEWNIELIEFIISLRPKYKTGVITDAWSGTREEMKDTINNDIFDEIVLSAEEGIQKPDPEIYYRALTQLGIAPGEAIFVDDREKNVEGAREVGMHAVLFTDTQQAKEEIERLLNG